MANKPHLGSIVPLGEAAALISFPDEAAALRFGDAMSHASVPWLLDVVQADATVAVLFDLDLIAFDVVAGHLHHLAGAGPGEPRARHHLIPCCYEFGPDLPRVCSHTGLAADEVIACHRGIEYTVHAIGFCPGFPYLGYLPPELCGVPRLDAPRVRVEVGSVGLTGRQTGIYTEPRPGGWNLIGRTPLELVHVADGYFPLRVGDRVRFLRIDEQEFERLRGNRLCDRAARPCAFGCCGM
jgi:inhibitor of KinA